MAKRKKKPVPLPRMEFSNGGPKLSTKQLNEFRFLLDLPDEYQRFLKWRNGGTPASPYFSRKGGAADARDFRIDRFFGLDLRGFDASRDNDVLWWILRFRHWFPKSAIPIAIVDDESYLLTFPSWDERADQVWFVYNFEISGMGKGDFEKCYFVADSVPQLISILHGRPDDEDEV